MAAINVRVVDSRNNTRDLVEAEPGATVAQILSGRGIPYTEAGYAISYRAPGQPIRPITGDALNTTVVSDMGEVFATFTQQKGN